MNERAKAEKEAPAAIIVLANWLAQQTQRKMAEQFDRIQQIQEASILTRHLQQAALCADMKVFPPSMDGGTQVAAEDGERGRSVRRQLSS